ncbi:MAG: carbohydrate ABC transporter permease [Muribaculaceae bacterium]|nr:carbohydrate ABC transporter permease [Muribaculaceae bacterium]
MTKSEERKLERRLRKIEEESHKSSMVVHPSLGGRVADVIIALALALIAFICIIPIWHVFMASVSDGYDLLGHKGTVWKPVGEATLAGYKLLFSDPSIITGYLNSIIYVIGGTGLGLLMNIFAGYILSRQTKLRGAMILFCVFTTMFNGGTVPTYMVIKALHMTGTRWSLIIPGCTNAIFMLLMMNAFSQVDRSYVEAAEVDGAGHLSIMFRVMLPQCKGMALVTAVNTAIMKWNSWFEASIYVPNQKELWPLQLWVKSITASSQDFMKATNPNYDKNLLQYTVIVAATAPILIAFPFFIKRLEKGMAMGGVKG